MIQLLKVIGGPGFLAFFAINVCVCILMMRGRPRWRRPAAAWLVIISGGYAILACPAVASAIADRVAASLPATERRSASPPDLLVVLGGDNPVGRVRRAIAASMAWPAAPIVVLGEDWMVADLRIAGIAASRLRQDGTPATTREQIEWVRTFAESHAGVHPALVASLVQAPRVAALAAAMRLQITLLPSPADSETVPNGLRRWLPSAGALNLSRDAIYEAAALTYYRAKGWI